MSRSVEKTDCFASVVYAWESRIAVLKLCC